jgi:hypothetical protein
MKYIIAESSLKSFIKDKYNVDLTGKIELIQNVLEVPMRFDDYITSRQLNLYLNHYGPMFLITIGNFKWIYQRQNKRYFFMDFLGNEISEKEFMQVIHIRHLGLSMDQLIELYYTEE